MENSRTGHYYREGWNYGERNAKSKLDADKVREIRKLHEERGMNFTTIGKMYGVDSTTVSRICGRRSWRHVTNNPASDTARKQSWPKKKAVSKTQVSKVDEGMYGEFATMHAKGMSHKQIGDKYGISRNTVYTCIQKYRAKKGLPLSGMSA